MSPLMEDFVEKCGGFTKKIDGVDCTVIPNLDPLVDMIMLDVIFSLKGRKSLGGCIEDLRTEVHIKDIEKRYGISDYALKMGPYFTPGIPSVSKGKKLKRQNNDIV